MRSKKKISKQLTTTVKSLIIGSLFFPAITKDFSNEITKTTNLSYGNLVSSISGSKWLSSVIMYIFTKLAAANNLKLNRRKSTEIVFVDPRRRRSVVPPSPLTGVSRVSSMKMLGITVTKTLSMAEHVKAIIHN